MASAVTIRRNFGPLAEVKLSTRALMQEVGLLARERIVRRTIAGQDEDGHSFAPYSKLYAERKGKELGRASVNLQVSGAMLNAITITDVTDTSVSLGFSS